VTVIGVTGNIASGKSTVLATLAELGAEVIDADHVYHELIVPGAPLNACLREAFGPGIAKSDGSIDRPALGRIVFSDPDALAMLDRLTHPAVDAEIRRRIAASSAPVIAVDAVKLFEGGLDRVCDAVWLVVTARDRQIERLAARNGFTVAEATRRVDAQPPLADKPLRADAVIDNSGSPEATRAQVLDLWSRIPWLPKCQ
jgi:dephospho-CoA kinase